MDTCSVYLMDFTLTDLIILAKWLPLRCCFLHFFLCRKPLTKALWQMSETVVCPM